MKHELSAPVQRCIGQVRSLCYPINESTTTLTIQSDEQTTIAHASGQIAQELRALPRRATICVTLRDTSTDDLEIIALILIST